MGKKATDITRDAKSFVKKWQGKGRERQDDKTFWEDLLEDVFGVERSRNHIEVQKPVRFAISAMLMLVFLRSSFASAIRWRFVSSPIDLLRSARKRLSSMFRLTCSASAICAAPNGVEMCPEI